MNFESVGPRFAAGAGLLAIIPVLVYGMSGSVVAGIVSAVNVVIIIGSLYIAMAPIDESHDDHHGNGTVS
ncbi:cytochrome-ba3 oxidase subunit [Natrinema sp. 1APR25-10V2]|uniref:cytochrome-ba3 oxidase subunit n=1 Tax=Natrinema sp. 1APR25-10V2 TaxID=2951081 RepID=UPI00287510FF|nr:cytochrome-ba3 oxidase subunit [Natrinema sp. 1APR25-10V2]MDS0473461.1 cytochrome-ba3 oxidase subunit [Natrinema sp. 1APR25-10V2]